tara:strand:- start:1708 stop:1815 length:108 start_codon:yes stop_codon:yes gene_type:complete
VFGLIGMNKKEVEPEVFGFLEEQFDEVAAPLLQVA